MEKSIYGKYTECNKEGENMNDKLRYFSGRDIRRQNKRIESQKTLNSVESVHFERPEKSNKDKLFEFAGVMYRGASKVAKVSGTALNKMDKEARKKRGRDNMSFDNPFAPSGRQNKKNVWGW